MAELPGARDIQPGAPGPTRFRGVGTLFPGLAEAAAKVGQVGQVLQEVKDRTDQLEDTAQEGKMLNEYREATSALLLDPKWSPMEPRARAEGQRDALKDLNTAYTEKLNEKIITPDIRVRATNKLGAWTAALSFQQQEKAQRETVQWSLNQHEVDTEKNRHQILAAPDADARLGIIAEFASRQEALRDIGAITPGEHEHGLRKFLVQLETDLARRTIEEADDPKRAYRDIIEQDTQRDPAHVLRLTDTARRDLFNLSNAVENVKYNDGLKEDRAKAKATEEASEAHFTRLQAARVAAHNANDTGAIKQLQLEAESLPIDQFTPAHLARFRSTDSSLSGLATGKDDPNALKLVNAMAGSKADPEDGSFVDRHTFQRFVSDKVDQGLLTEGSGAAAMAQYDTTKIPAHNANDRAAVAGLTRDVGQIEIDTNALRASADAAGSREAVIRNMQAEAVQLFTAHREQFPTSTPEESAAYALDAVKRKNAPLVKKLDVGAFARAFPEQARRLNPDLPLAPQIGAMHRRGEFPRERAPEVLQYLKNDAAEEEVFRQKKGRERGIAAAKAAAEPGITAGQQFENTVRGWFGADPRYKENQITIGKQLQAAQAEVQRLEGVQRESPSLETPTFLGNAKQRESELRAQLLVPEVEMNRMIALLDRMKTEADPTKKALLEAEWDALAAKHGHLLGIPAQAAPEPPEAKTSTTLFTAGEQPEGMSEPGNINLLNRPAVRNPDGSISSVRSMSVNIGGKEVLMPTVSEDGRIMSNEEAIEQYKRTGKHLGIFDTPEHATAYAKTLHEQQAALVAPAPAPGPMSFEPPVETAITTASAKHNVPVDLIRAVAFEESRGNVEARNVQAGKEDSYGVMQINAVAHLSFDKSRAFDPDYNVDFGVALLASLLKQHKGDVEKAVAAYNGSGPQARAYAKRVLARKAQQ